LALARHGYRRWSVRLGDTLDTLTYGGFWRMARRYWKTGLGEVYRSFSKRAFVRALQRLIPEVRTGHLEPGGAGVRAQALDASGALLDDFRIVTADRMVHVLNAPSPAATASIAIGHYVAHLALKVLPGPSVSVSSPPSA
jgi:L-2-hydroxyglutarate oxidase